MSLLLLFPSGSVTSFTGTGAGTESGDASSASGVLTFTGTGTGTEAGDNSSASGSLTFTGSGVGTEAGDNSAGSGAEIFSGGAAGTEIGDNSSASGALVLSGSGGGTEGSDNGAGSGPNTTTGTGSGTEAGDNSSGSGTQAVPDFLKKQLIINAWKTRLALIRTSGGYYSNIGQKVYEWKVTPLDAPRTDGIVLREGDESPERTTEDGAIEMHQMPMEVRVVLKNPAGMDKAREMEADIRRAVRQDVTFSGLVYDLEHQATAMDIDREKDVLVGVTLTFNLIYHTLTLQSS